MRARNVTRADWESGRWRWMPCRNVELLLERVLAWRLGSLPQDVCQRYFRLVQRHLLREIIRNVNPFETPLFSMALRHRLD